MRLSQTLHTLRYASPLHNDITAVGAKHDGESLLATTEDIVISDKNETLEPRYCPLSPNPFLPKGEKGE